jgi:antitoxin HicB
MSNDRVSGNYNDVLAEQGLLADVVAFACKVNLVKQIKETMKEKNLTRRELARLMGTSTTAVTRILDPSNTGINLSTIVKVAVALGCRVKINLSDS